MEQKARFKVLAPVLRADGPDLLPDYVQPAPEDLMDRGKEEFCERVLDVVEECTRRPCGVEEIVLQMWRALMRQCVDGFRYDFDMDDVEDYTISQQLDAMMEAIADRWSIQWLCGHLPHDSVEQVTGKGELDAVEEINKLVQARIRHQVVLRPIKLRCLILLHLFSGHRRQGDVMGCARLL